MLPLVVTVIGPEATQQRTLAFAESPVFVGRGPLNELELLEPWVARTEGVLEFDGEGVHYTRQSNRNHVTVDGRELSASGPVRVQSELAIGRLRLACTRRQVPEELLWRARPADDAAAPVQRAETVVLGGPAIEPASEPSVRPPATTKREPSGQSPLPAVRPLMAAVLTGGPTESPLSASVAASPAQPAFAYGEAASQRAGDLTPQLSDLYETYRRAWSALELELSRQLESAPEALRAQLAHDLQRSFPQSSREPTFRELLKRLGLKPRKPDDPDVEQWLHRIEQVLPPGVKLQSGFTVERLLEIVEGYTSAFVDLNDAQEEVRRRALGKLSRESLLQKSDDPNVILAYLLNPEAKWSSRLAELGSVVKTMVRHEWALMQATMEGARELLESLSPAEIAKREGSQLPERGEPGEKGFWHARANESPAARLWFRFVDEHQALLQGDHYQRSFLGARFSKRYTKAMGVSEETHDKK